MYDIFCNVYEICTRDCSRASSSKECQYVVAITEARITYNEGCE